MTPVGFETKISACERPKTYALNRAATEAGLGHLYSYVLSYFESVMKILHISDHFVPVLLGSLQTEVTIIVIIGIPGNGI